MDRWPRLVVVGCCLLQAIQPVLGRKVVQAQAVEIPRDLGGDCNADGVVDGGDVTACTLEFFDGDGSSWTDVPGGGFPGDPVGCDANADTFVNAGDLSCTARLIQALVCDPPSSQSLGSPRLSFSAVLEETDGVVTVTVTFEGGGAQINSIVFSLDYDESRLWFDDNPGAVRFVGGSSSVEWQVNLDGDDLDGELDTVLVDLTTTGVIPDGPMLEIDLLLLLPGAGTVEGAGAFSEDPPASFGDLGGRSVPGTAEVGPPFPLVFADGFESGDLSVWSAFSP